jgi:U3 small nucleolar RNA-associated protein 5
MIDAAPAMARGGGGGGAPGSAVKKGGGAKRKGSSGGDDALAATAAAVTAVTAAAAAGDVARNADTDMNEEGGGKTLGERVRAIERIAGGAGSSKGGSGVDGDGGMTATDKAVADALGGGKGAPPKADSLATLLSQVNLKP